MKMVHRASQSTDYEHRGTNVAIQDSFQAKLELLLQFINSFEETPNCAGDTVLPFNTNTRTGT